MVQWDGKAWRVLCTVLVYENVWLERKLVGTIAVWPRLLGLSTPIVWFYKDILSSLDSHCTLDSWVDGIL